MSSKWDHGPRTADRFARAAALVRALTDVVDARIEADASGIRTIAVTAVPGTSAWEITRNVQSALLASLGLSIDRSVVRVSHAGDDGAQAPAPPDVAVSAKPGPNGAVPEDSPAAAPWPTRPNGGRASLPANGSAPVRPLGSNGAGLRPNGNGHSNGAAVIVGQPNGKASAATAELAPASTSPPAVGAGGVASIARLELETRRDARLSCRVVVALPDRIAAGESEGEDTPAGRLEAAARAVIAAAPAVGAEFDGIRAVDVAGRSYVLVAVRRWSGRELTYRAAVASQDASPEAAAARATLDALLS